MKFLYWLSLFFIIYTYAGYPFFLFIWSSLFSRKVNKKYLSPDPAVTIIIAARNEEKNIRKRIENILSQNYPFEKMEIIIISDGSTDATSKIVNDFIESNPNQSDHPDPAFPKIILIDLDENKGKPHALNLGVQQSSGDFIVFADSRQIFERNAIRELIANFNDPAVGCVSGELLIHEDRDSTLNVNMAFYWNLEKQIRLMESAVHSVAGATGAIYAIRKSLYQPMPEKTLIDDVFIPMNVVLKGYRTIFDSFAIAYDTFSKHLDQEKRRKIRTLLGNYQLLQIMPDILSPKKNPIFFRYLSHKVFRLFVPFFFILFLLSSLMTSGYLYKLTFIITMVTLVLPFFDKIILSVPILSGLSKLSRTFVSLNYFALIAFYRFILPGKKRVW